MIVVRYFTRPRRMLRATQGLDQNAEKRERTGVSFTCVGADQALASTRLSVPEDRHRASADGRPPVFVSGAGGVTECRMKQFAFAFAVSVAATTAIAQPRPSTVVMSCGQAAGLVASRGAVVLGTGGHTYDRFVSDGRFCLRNEITEPAWVPAGDTRQCLVGYRCRERTPHFR